MRRLLLVLTLVLCSSLVVFAQPAEPPAPPAVAPAPALPPSPPAAPRPEPTAGGFRPARTILLDVRGVDIDHVLRLLGTAAGLTIVKDPELRGSVTIIAPQAVTLDEAFEILNAELGVIGYTTIRQGNVLKVVKLERALQMTTETHVGREPNDILPGDRVITQIVPLTTLDATTLAGQLAPLTMSEASLIPDAETNTLFIIDTATNVRRLLGIINQMEQRSSASIRVFRLQYVGAEDMADLISGIVSGAGAAGGAAGPWPQRLMPGRGPTGARAARAPMPTPTPAAVQGTEGFQVVPDPRTNSLIVTASPERLDFVAGLIAEFDRPVDYSSTLAILPLQHARADDVAALLTQAFGGAATGTRPTTPTTTDRTTRRQQPTGITSGAGAYQSQIFRPGAPEDDQENPVLVSGRGGLSSGDVTLAQATAAPQVGRTSEGRVVPLIEASDIIVIADPATNSLIVNAVPEKLELVRAIVRNLDIIPTQVLIQGIVAEVSISKRNQLGIEFELNGENIFGTNARGTTTSRFGLQQTDTSGNPIPLTGLAFSVVNGERFTALLNALATDSDVSILSTPRIFTTSGKKATIDDSTLVPFATGRFTSSIGGGVSTSFNYQSVGIVLEVTPVVSQDGTVTMEVSQTADELLRFEPLAEDLRLPVVARRLAEATVSIRDGETVILGGLISNRRTRTVTGIPILKDLPLLGWLFQSRDTQKEKTELLIFLTPRVVRGPEEAQMLTQQQRSEGRDLPRIPMPRTPIGTDR